MTFGLGAKLFGISALVIAVIAVARVKVTHAMVGLYVHAIYVLRCGQKNCGDSTYIAVPARHVFLALALLCAAFAAFYYLGDRALGHRWHNGLTIAHFLLWILSAVIFVLEANGLERASLVGRDPNNSWLLLAGFVVPYLAFPLGGAAFFANFVRAIVLKRQNPT